MPVGGDLPVVDGPGDVRRLGRPALDEPVVEEPLRRLARVVLVLPRGAVREARAAPACVEITLAGIQSLHLAGRFLRARGLIG